MKITKIEKKKRLYLLEIDDAEQLYVTEDTIVRFMLTKQMVIDEELLEAIKEFAQFSHGKNLALYYLSFKARTTKEVKDYLIKSDIDEKYLPSLIEQLTQEKWLDDERYARQIFEQNSLSGDKGEHLLRQKLLQKGISKAILDQVSQDYDLAPIALKVAEKLYRQYQTKLSHQSLVTKLIQSLVSKGFSYEQAQSAITQLSMEKDDETENELLQKEFDKQYRKYSRKYDGYELQQRLTQALARKGFSYDLIRQVLRDNHW